MGMLCMWIAITCFIIEKITENVLEITEGKLLLEKYHYHCI